MKDLNSYNLNGLRAVFWGMLLELASGIGTGAFQGMGTRFSAQIIDYISIGFSALSLIAILMVIIGLSRVGKYSSHFRRSRNYYVWSLVLVLMAFVLALLAYWFVDKNKDSSGTMLGTVAMIVIALVLLLIAGWLGILKIKQMMNGCADIARQNDEKKYAAKCTRAWVYYMVLIVVALVLAVILVVAAVKALVMAADATGGQINSIEEMAGGFQYFFHVAAALGVTLILLFISYLLVMGKVNGTLMRYHKVEIPAGLFDEEDVPVPPMEDEEDEVTKQTPVIPEPPAQIPEEEPEDAPEKGLEEGLEDSAEEPVEEAPEKVEAEPSKAEAPAKAPVPMKQSGKHGKASGLKKQAVAKHAAPKQVRDEAKETKEVE